MAYAVETLKELTKQGGNLDISEISYAPGTIKELLMLARESGAHITIAGSYSPNVVLEFAEIAGNQLTVKVD